MLEWLIKEDKIVGIKAIDAAMLQKMFIAGAKNIEARKEYINELDSLVNNLLNR